MCDCLEIDCVGFLKATNVIKFGCTSKNIQLYIGEWKETEEIKKEATAIGEGELTLRGKNIEPKQPLVLVL